MARRKKSGGKAPVFTRDRLAVVLTVTGVFCMMLWGVHAYVYHATLTLPDAVVSQYTATDRIQSEPVSINIPGVAQLSVVEAGKVNGVWSVSDTQANHVRQSAVPGSRGNIILYGHNTKNIFGKLKKIQNGTIISVVSRNGTIHEYRVEFTKTVAPSDTSLLAPANTEILTIYTCTGWLDSKRFVVRAIPV